MITLYLATHNISGLKYFGRSAKYHTKAELQDKYHGSGVAWKKHLDEFGDDVTMDIFLSSEDEELIKSVALMYSEFWGIVESKDYANLIVEDGTTSCGMKGLKHSDESKLKMSLSTIGQVFTEETRSKMSESSKGKPKSKEHKDNIKNARIGTKRLNSTKTKISNTKKGCKWIKKGKQSKTVYPNEVEQYLSNGWMLGRYINKHKEK